MTRATSKKTRDAAATIFLQCGIAKVAQEHNLFGLGIELRELVRTVSLEAISERRTQIANDPLIPRSQQRQSLTSVFSKGKMRKLECTDPLTEPTSKEAVPPLTNHQSTRTSVIQSPSWSGSPASNTSERSGIQDAPPHEPVKLREQAAQRTDSSVNHTGGNILSGCQNGERDTSQ
jgi:hypothetical protein